MTLTLQNLRAVGSGVEPASLLPGQICFNLADKTLFVGDGSDSKTLFNGDENPGTPGKGWYSMPMDSSSLGTFFVPNPAQYGDIPADDQVITWSQSLRRPVWAYAGGGPPYGNSVYRTTNSAVAAAPGATTSEKIIDALGLVSLPEEGDVVLVEGLNGETYTGVYFYLDQWYFGSAYGEITASTVPYNNSFSGLTATFVQGAIDEVANIASTGIQSSSFTAKGDILAGTGASSFSALPSGGNGFILSVDATEPTGLKWIPQFSDVQTVSGVLPVVVNNTDPQNPVVSVNAAGIGLSGVVALNDTVVSASTTEAATANAVRQAYDLASAALPLTGGTLTGTLITQDIQVGSGFEISFSLPGVGGTLEGISDSTSLSLSNIAASTVAVKAAFDLADAALPESGGTMTGFINFANNQPIDAGLY